MVGFGSSLRMGRRTGWESAYLDYETLKLLLSQIEAVYEERDLGTGASADGFFMNMPGTGRGGGGGGFADSERNTSSTNLNNNNNETNNGSKTMDYRDELFLESNSDLAFASEVDVGDDEYDDDDSDEYGNNRDVDVDRVMLDESFEYNYTGTTVWEQQGLGQHHMHVDPTNSNSQTEPSSSATSMTMTLGHQQLHQHQHQHQQRQQRPSAFSVSAYATTKGSVYSTSSEEDDDYYAENSAYDDKCAPWSTAKKKKKERHKSSSSSSKKSSGIISKMISSNRRENKKNHRESSLHGASNHLLQRSNSGGIQDAFIVQKGTSGSDYYNADANQDGNDGAGKSNYYYYKFSGNDNDNDNDGDNGVNNIGRTSAIRSNVFRSNNIDNSASASAAAREGSPLLGGGGGGPSTPSVKDGKYKFVSFPTPGRVDRNLSHSKADGYGSLFNNPNTNPITPAKPSARTNVVSTVKESSTRTSYSTIKQDEQKIRYERERRHARKQRRRRRLIRQRREREKTVPPHIRIAHEKSRAITERFLGLLRAEVEKVTLFAQARLGELADTAGSLRFLSSDERMEISATHTGSYDYPLSDGGIHPSASSSSDEGAGGGYHHQHKGGFPWSDSSSEDEVGSKASGTGRLDIAQTFSSTDGYSARTDPQVNTTAEKSSSFSLFSRAKNYASSSGRRSPGRPAFTETQEKFEATTRKIAHFQEIRRERSIFNRNDYIVGEDLLLISAVDEADAFSAVGVELLHILKYICVNLIAVRKICKKHDRLLMNRMLGGYYHRKRTTRSQEDTTLGGLIAHVAGDIYEAHPDLIGLVNNGKLIGIYDLKIQQLANSRTVKVVSSCLALALSEYEVSRWRADALAKLNPGVKKGRKAPSASQDQGNAKWTFSLGTDNCIKNPNSSQQHEQSHVLLQNHDVYVGSDDEHGAGPPSTTSALSLSRLRYAVLSIAALREASRIKSNPFSSYLSRSTLTFTGHAIIGEGLDGCSRDTLDVLLAYNPDAALLLDTSAIYEGLTCGQWRKASIAGVMTSSLAVALTLPSSGQSSAPLTISPRTLHEKESFVSNALGILPPKSEGLYSKSPLDGAGLPPSIFLRISRFTDIPPSILRANRLSLLLYNANYFIAHPTSVTLVLNSDENIAYSALVIGAPAISAIIISMLHCHVLSEYYSKKESSNENISIFRYLLMLSSLCAVMGNVVQVYGIEHNSIELTILGRFLLGFSAVEIVNRQFVVCFLPACLIVAESARLVQFQVSGQILGLLIGSLAGSFVKTSSELNPVLPSVVIESAAPKISLSIEENARSRNRRKLFHNDTGRHDSTSGISPTLSPTLAAHFESKLSAGITSSSPESEGASGPSYIPATSHDISQLPVDSTKSPTPTIAKNESLPGLSSSNFLNASDFVADAHYQRSYIPSMSPSSSQSIKPLDSMIPESEDNQVDRLTAANWFMVSLWLMYLFYILFGWKVSNSARLRVVKKEKTSDTDTIDYGSDNNENDHSSYSSVSDQETGHANLLRNTSNLRDIGVDGNYAETESTNILENTISRPKEDKPRSPKRKRRRKIRTFTKRIRKLMLYSIAIPVSLVLIVWTVFAQEILFSSCALITKSYFSWRGSVTGLFLASLWVILLPMDYCCEHLARRYEERFTVRQSIFLLGLGLLVMVNWGSLFALIPNIKNLFKEDHSNRHHHYDWMLGVGQYIVGFIIAFTALRALGIGSRSLLSKVSPPNLHNVVINLGTIVTFVTLFSQMFANFYISSIVLSHREINVDILNSLLMPSLIATLVMYYLVRKHYFFLM